MVISPSGNPFIFICQCMEEYMWQPLMVVYSKAISSFFLLIDLWFGLFRGMCPGSGDTSYQTKITRTILFSSIIDWYLMA